MSAASPPSRGRGSKPNAMRDDLDPQKVASLAGAWIETVQKRAAVRAITVASLAGAWIETSPC